VKTNDTHSVGAVQAPDLSFLGFPASEGPRGALAICQRHGVARWETLLADFGVRSSAQVPAERRAEFVAACRAVLVEPSALPPLPATSPTGEGDADAREALAFDVLDAAALAAELREERARTGLLGQVAVPAAVELPDGVTVGDLADRHTLAELQQMADALSAEIDALGVYDMKAHAAALAERSPGDVRLPDMIECLRPTTSAPLGEKVVQGIAGACAAALIERGDVPATIEAPKRDLRLPIEAFPYTRQTAKGRVPTNHSANYVALLQRSGFGLAYDVIQKEIVATVDGQPLPKSDHEGEVLLRRATDLCVLNRVPTDNLQSTLTSLAAGNPVNPVVAYLVGLRWDHKPRFDKLAEAVGASDPAAARAAFRIFLIQACAAADGGERGMRANPRALPKYETVLVLQGEQGSKKTSGLRGLLPAPLRQYMQDGLTLVNGDRDSERQAISSWLTELGELEATLRRSELERLKAFMSRREDRLRVAYGRTDSRFQRRTVFVASANSAAILTDLTGSRRFAVLSVSNMALDWSDEEIDQLWAEAFFRYYSGEQWWPTAEEEIALRGAAQRFETTSDIEERLLERYDWERGTRGVRTVQRLPVSKILDLLRPGSMSGRGHSMAEMSQTRETILRLWRRHGAKIKDGELSVRVLDEWVPVYWGNGKNRGMLLPAEREEPTNDPQGLL